ncbi:MAG TPA: phenylacetate--CoA ligase family protein [Polyangiaceae bacterium]|nr:phenylacetate--CoA ligase family protein [Polyangiaceae bacterium]
MDSRRAAKTLAAFHDFMTTPLDAALAPGPDAAESALALFRTTAESVPAYRVFLDEAGFDPASVRTTSDFARVPVMTKANYVQRHPLAARCRDGRVENGDMVAVSSGSTGTPTFWPRGQRDEYVVARRFEQIFADAFGAGERRTLAVVCFALGTWVGGMYTTNGCRLVAARGYPITVVTPGNVKEEIIRVLRELAPGFEQVVLLGYPPFLKDALELAKARGLDLRAMNLRCVMAGEVFSESWRELLLERMGATSPCYATASLYGTADGGVLANETPLSIAIRRLLAARPELARELFGESRLPTLAQYDPRARFFEEVDGSLLFTSDGGVPLVRYAILDRGGVFAHDVLVERLRAAGLDPYAELDGGRGARPLPFVFVFGRSDFTVSFYGANVYPENVSVGLEAPEVSDFVSGKFVMEVVEGGGAPPALSLTVELAPGEVATDARVAAVRDSTLAALLRLNSEFASYVPEERRAPAVRLLPSGDPAYFPAGVKHRYTRRAAH